MNPTARSGAVAQPPVASNVYDLEVARRAKLGRAAEHTPPKSDFGSGWYHEAAIASAKEEAVRPHAV